MKNLLTVLIGLSLLSLILVGGCTEITIPSIFTPTPTGTLTPTPSSVGTSMVYGGVLDSVTGAFLSDVTVKVDGKLAYTTLADGGYEVRGLTIGTHIFTFEKAGFKTETFTLNIPQDNFSVQHYVYMKRL